MTLKDQLDLPDDAQVLIDECHSGLTFDIDKVEVWEGDDVVRINQRSHV